MWICGNSSWMKRDLRLGCCGAWTLLHVFLSLRVCVCWSLCGNTWHFCRTVTIWLDFFLSCCAAELMCVLAGRVSQPLCLCPEPLLNGPDVSWHNAGLDHKLCNRNEQTRMPWLLLKQSFDKSLAIFEYYSRYYYFYEQKIYNKTS